MEKAKTEIKCKKETCEYNTGCSCCAGCVTIDRGTHCNSFVENPLKEELTEAHGHIFQVPDKKVKRNIKNVPLNCTATSCLFNKDKLCQANGITVIDEEQKADCATYCEKPSIKKP
jgi:hypothetical protein